MRSLVAPGGVDGGKPRIDKYELGPLLTRLMKGKIEHDRLVELPSGEQGTWAKMLVHVTDPALLVPDTPRIYWGQIVSIGKNNNTGSDFLHLATRAADRASIMLTREERTRINNVFPTDIRQVIARHAICYGTCAGIAGRRYIKLHDANSLWIAGMRR